MGTDLYAIAVMHVPIHDENSFDVVGLQRVLRSHGHVVQQAEPVGLVSLSVMTWRSNHGQPFLRLILEN